MSDKIKLSAIREQFPMYADVSDEDLLLGLRRKFYSDIPLDKFVGRIEFDNVDPTEGMSGTQKFLAGVGKGMTDVGRGVGQMFGLVSRDDVAAARKLDAPLMRTGAGKAGSVAGSVATMLPTAFIPGANTLAGATAIGAASGLAQPSESTGETMQNVAAGGLLGPASLLAGRGVAAGVQAARGLVQPLTAGGQRQVAGATLRSFATDAGRAAQSLRGAQQIVPGSAPTMAQATMDPGLAQLERTLMSNPETSGTLVQRLAEQRAARLAAVQGVAGTPAARDAAVAARAAATGPLYQAGTQAAYFVDDTLGDLMRRPAMQSALQRAQRLANNQGRPPIQMATETAAPFAGVGGAQAMTRQTISGQGLQDLKMALDDMLSDPLAGIGKNEASAVKATRAKLLEWMEGANPAFKEGRETFTAMSRPINTMDVADDLLSRMQSPLSRAGAGTRELKDAYARALEQAGDSVKRQIGIDVPMEQVVDPGAIGALRGVARDMARSAEAEGLGRAAGSNTAQNLASQNLLRRALGPTGLPQSWAESTALQTMLAPVQGLYKLGGAEGRVMGLLSEAAADPTLAAELLQLAAKPGTFSALASRAEPYLPAASMGLLSYRP